MRLFSQAKGWIFLGGICLQIIGIERDAYMAKLKAQHGRKLGFCSLTANSLPKTR